MEKLKKFIRNPWMLFVFMAHRGLLDSMSDELYLKVLFRAKHGRRLNLDTPKSFNEKMQWLKLHYRNPEIVKMVDKYAVKQYVAERLGQESLIRTIGVYDKFEDIVFADLPDQFVLKTTHDSGGVVICKNKHNFDVEAARDKLNRSLKSDYSKSGREWMYHEVPHRIICEDYFEDEDGELKDYKIYCFNGEAKAMMLASNRFTDKQTTFDYFDKDFNWLDMTWGKPRSKKKPPKPKNFEEMFSIAEVLSKGLPHVRVDLYSVSGRVYFGEMTFFDGSGMDRIEPYEWDLRFGEWLQLPEVE